MKLLREQDFIHRFVDEIAVGLTSMFRNPVLWTSLRDDVLETMRHKQQISVWHAGCSTGEEVHTMSIVLKESGLLSKARLTATDISTTALAAAKVGEYHILKIDKYKDNYFQYNAKGRLEEYYQPTKEGIQMNDELSQHVDFKAHNLVTSAPPGKFDIIFCRNVMIYFDQPTKARLLDQFSEHLNEGGYLITGFFDALIPLIDKKKYRIANIGAKVFQKMDEQVAVG